MATETMRSAQVADVEHRFKYHPPRDTGVENLHTAVRERCLELARGMAMNLPDGREKALALTKLEEAMFWANAAIARISNYENQKEEQGHG